MSYINVFVFVLFIAIGALVLFLTIHKVLFKKVVSNSYLDSDTSKEINKPLVKIADLLPGSVSSSSHEIDKKFKSAGFYYFEFAKLYLPIKYGFGILGGIGIWFYFNEVQTAMVLLGIWIVVCIVGPDKYLDYRANSLHRHLSGQLPYLLDLLAMCVHSGMTIESALSYLSNELQGLDRDLAHMVRRTTDRASIIGISPALDELYENVPTVEVRNFVMTLKQSLRHGSSIYETLINLAGDIRAIHLLSLEEKVGKLSAKMSVPLILFIMIPVVILIAAPGVMRVLPNAF
jgi:tight adherence protein C